jgi:hypothetical protein
VRARRWVGVAGLVLVFTGLLGVARVEARPGFVGEVALEAPPDWQSFPPPVKRSARARLLEELQRPEVRDVVRERLGHVPAIRVSSGGAGEVVIRSRATSPERAAQAATTYAASFVDIRREEAGREIGVAAGLLQQRLDELQMQLDQADVANRDSLLRQQGLFVERLDLLRRDAFVGGPEILRSTTDRSPAGPVAWLWLLAGLGVVLASASRVPSLPPRSA